MGQILFYLASTFFSTRETYTGNKASKNQIPGYMVKKLRFAHQKSPIWDSQIEVQ